MNKQDTVRLCAIASELFGDFSKTDSSKRKCVVNSVAIR